MRCSFTVVCLVVAMVAVGLSGCHSTGTLASRSWTNSSFNPTTWRTGFQQTPSSLAAAPPALPAKPSTAFTPSYPSTSATGSLASSTFPPKVTYPTTPAGYTSTRSTRSTALGSTAKSQLMAPQTGRYGTSPIASSAPSGFANPVYQKTRSSAPLVQNPYRSTAPTVPRSNGSLAGGAAVATTSPYGSKMPSAYPSGLSSRQTPTAGQNLNTNSRYPAAIASSAAKASAPSYRNDPNSRYYTGPASKTATTTTPFGSPTMPKVVSGYPTTSPRLPVISTAKAPSGSYPNVRASTYTNNLSQPTGSTVPKSYTSPKSYTPAPVNVTAPVNSNMPVMSSPVNSNMPVMSSTTTTPPSSTYQPGANSYQPGANQYVPGQNRYTPAQNGYQIPAVRSTAPIQSGTQVPPMFPMVPPVTGNTNSMGSQAPGFRPGSTGTVPAYPPSTGSTAPISPYSAIPYSKTPSGWPLKTSSSSSSVVPAGFNQTAPILR